MLFSNSIMSAKKKELKEKANEDRLSKTIVTLEAIIKNRDIQRNTRNLVKDVLATLTDEKGGSISVRAANAISMLESLTQSRQMESHIRTMLWQVVSTLESIREWSMNLCRSRYLNRIVWVANQTRLLWIVNTYRLDSIRYIYMFDNIRNW